MGLFLQCSGGVQPEGGNVAVLWEATSQRAFSASATKKITDPPIAAIQNKSISNVSLRPVGQYR